MRSAFVHLSNASRYCPVCVKPLTEHPTLRLPIKVHVVTHPAEKRTSNTGVHAALLAPADVDLVSFDTVAASVTDAEHSAVLFPADDAEPVSSIDVASIRHIYVIDRCETPGPAPPSFP